MTLMLLLLIVALMVGYGLWMAGRLGVGPRFGRSDHAEARRTDTASRARRFAGLDPHA